MNLLKKFTNHNHLRNEYKGTGINKATTMYKEQC